MNIGSLGNSLLKSQIHNVKESQQSLATSQLKSAMNSPKQYLNLLEASVAVKNTINLAQSQGIGTNVDITI
jgi:hypothetical protein